MEKLKKYSCKVYKGSTRITILFWKFAFKIPRMNASHYIFLNGCKSNYGERWYCKVMKNVENNKFYNLVAPSIFCFYFGLLQVQYRCEVNTVELTDEQLLMFKDVRNGETKPCNFGYYNQRLVCLDYA